MPLSQLTGRAHVGDEEAAIWLRHDLIGNGGQECAITLLVLWLVRVRDIKVVSGVLSLEQGQETTAPDCLSILGHSEMMWRVARSRHIDYSEQSAKGIIVKRVRCEEIGVLVVTGTSPEVTDLLWLDVASLPRW